MNEKKWYISLTCKGSNDFHSEGQQLKLTERTINIGESADCDVRYENGDFSPEYYASILKNDDGQSWRIVRRSQHVGVSIVGKGPIGYASPLTDGDIIQFEGQPMTLLFHTHNDRQYNEETRRLSTWLRIVIAAACLTVGLGAIVYSTHRDPISSFNGLPIKAEASKSSVGSFL